MFYLSHLNLKVAQVQMHLLTTVRLLLFGIIVNQSLPIQKAIQTTVQTTHSYIPLNIFKYTL